MKKLLALCLVFVGVSKGASQTIFSEDFSSITNLTAAGWTLYNDGFTPNGYQDIFPEAWAVVEWAVESPNSTVSSTSQLDEGFAADRWLISPPISISPSIAGATLNFKANSIDGFPLADGFTLKISTTNTAKSSFTTLLTVAHAPITSIESTSFTVVNLAAYAGQTIYLAWVEDTLGGNILNVDDINVSQTLLSVPNFESSQFSVYPNPVKDIARILSATDTTYDVQIYDSYGRCVNTIEGVTKRECEIDMSSYSAGVYFLKMNSNSTTETFGIVKE